MRALASALTLDRPATEPAADRIGQDQHRPPRGRRRCGRADQGGAGRSSTATSRPTCTSETPNRLVSLADLKIDVPATGRPFPACERRVAGVNSFGFGGTNAHVVLAEPPAPADVAVDGHAPQPAPTSCRSRRAARRRWWRRAGRLAEHLAAHPDVTLSDLGYTLGQRRAHLNHRHTRDRRQHRRRARTTSGPRRRRADLRRPHRLPPRPKLAFVCTGMGPQWWRMCRGLLDVFPAFTDSIHAQRPRAVPLRGLVAARRTPPRREPAPGWRETEIAQPANFAIQVALAEQLARLRDHTRRRDRPQRRRGGRPSPGRPAHLRAGDRGDLPPKPTAAAHQRAWAACSPSASTPKR